MKLIKFTLWANGLGYAPRWMCDSNNKHGDGSSGWFCSDCRLKLLFYFPFILNIAQCLSKPTQGSGVSRKSHPVTSCRLTDGCSPCDVSAWCKAEAGRHVCKQTVSWLLHTVTHVHRVSPCVCVCDRCLFSALFSICPVCVCVWHNCSIIVVKMKKTIMVTLVLG